MSRSGNGGTWNRAGRRSGGARPANLTPAPYAHCTCGASTPFGLLPEFLVSGAAVKCCPSCKGALFVKREGRWQTAAETFQEPPHE